MSKKSVLPYGIMFNLAALFGGVSLYLNDKLRSDLEYIVKNNQLKETLYSIHNKSANRYDKFYGRVEARNKINKYRKILTSYSGDEVLETGCGTGRNFCFYKKNQNITAIDYSDNMLNVAKNVLDTKKVNNGEGSDNDIICENINLQNVDCEELAKTFGENKFDSIVDIMNFQAYYNPELVLENMKKVVKNNGKIIIICRGISEYLLIDFFYSIYKPTTIMRYGVDYSKNWKEFFNKDKDLKCLYEDRKNFGKTYLFIFEVNKTNI